MTASIRHGLLVGECFGVWGSFDGSNEVSSKGVFWTFGKAIGLACSIVTAHLCAFFWIYKYIGIDWVSLASQ
jgi:hypothetical protein